MVLVRPATLAEYAVIGEFTVAAYRADGQLDDEPDERVLRDVARRAHRNEVLVATDEESGQLLGTVTFVLPGSDLAQLSRPGEAEFRIPPPALPAQPEGAGPLISSSAT